MSIPEHELHKPEVDPSEMDLTKTDESGEPSPRNDPKSSKRKVYSSRHRPNKHSQFLARGHSSPNRNLR